MASFNINVISPASRFPHLRYEFYLRGNCVRMVGVIAWFGVPSFVAVYATLSRLEGKGYVRSRLGAPTAEQTKVIDAARQASGS